MLTYADVSLHLRAASRIFLLTQHSCRQMRRRCPNSCQVTSYYYICGYICVLILLYMRRRFPSSCQVPHTTRCLILVHMCPHATVYAAIYVSSYYYICGERLLYAASSCQARTNGWRLRQPTTSRATASTPQVCCRMLTYADAC